MLLAHVPKPPCEQTMCNFLGQMLREGLAKIGIKASKTHEDQYYRIKFNSFNSFINFFNKYFLPYRIEVKENKSEQVPLEPNPYQVEFAIEELPEDLRDFDIMRILMDLTKKVGLNPCYQKNAGVCSVKLPFETLFVLFIEVIQKLFK